MAVPIFCINLERAADRLAFMHEQAAKAGITFERVPGNWGLEVTPDAIRDKFLRPDGTKKTRLRPGQIGCYSSHLKTYALIVERDLPMALVLEDDVELPADLVAIVDEIIAHLPPAWDFVKLCNDPKRAVYSVRRIGSRHLVRFSRQPSKGGGYLVSRSGALKMLAPESRPFPFDGELSRPWRFGLDIYGVCPKPINQLVLPSATIAQGGRADIWKSPYHRVQGTLYGLSKMGPWGLMKCRVAEALGTLRGTRTAPLIVE